MLVTATLVSIIVFIVARWMWKRKDKFVVFESMGIPGPKPSFIDGNQREFNEKGLLPWMSEGYKKYGKVWGYYENLTPVMVVSDVEMIKQILVKEFTKFNVRKPISLAAMQDKYVNVFDAEGARWKRLRTLSAPHFSAKSMKQMSPLINSVIDNLMELMKKHGASQEPFNIHGEFQKMTLDVITSTAFGIETETVKNGDSVWLQKVKWIFNPREHTKRPLHRKIIHFVLLNSPGLKQIALKVLSGFFTKYLQWFFSAAEAIIKERKLHPSNRRDFITLMLEANEINPNVSEDKLTMDVDDEEDDSKINKTPEGEKILKGLTSEEMQAQSFIFLTAGYETTSTALGFLAHELSRHPDIQERLQQEIDEHFIEENCRPDYSTVSKLQYMDMVVNENLRLNNIAATALTRVCRSTCQVGKYTIPEGMAIQIDSNQVLLDEELWGPEDPKEFVPERFSRDRKSNRHQLAFLPFGGGPRNCVGMRFALMEIKIALTRLLKMFTIKDCEKTQVPLPVNTANIQSPSEGVYVKLVPRHQ